MIANGYEEQDCAKAEEAAVTSRDPSGPVVLLHSGLLYQSERDPNAFFGAVADLRRQGDVSPADLKIVLRASGNESNYRSLLRENGIDDIVFLEPARSHVQALREMRDVDGLLGFQAANCNRQ